MLLQVGEEGKQLLNVIPDAIQGFFQTAPIGPLQLPVTIKKTGAGKLRPLRLKACPLGAQPTFKTGDDSFIRGIQGADVRG